jgi:hypothetical protein
MEGLNLEYTGRLCDYTNIFKTNLNWFVFLCYNLLERW